MWAPSTGKAAHLVLSAWRYQSGVFLGGGVCISVAWVGMFVCQLEAERGVDTLLQCQLVHLLWVKLKGLKRTHCRGTCEEWKQLVDMHTHTFYSIFSPGMYSLHVRKISSYIHVKCKILHLWEKINCISNVSPYLNSLTLCRVLQLYCTQYNLAVVSLPCFSFFITSPLPNAYSCVVVLHRQTRPWD